MKPEDILQDVFVDRSAFTYGDSWFLYLLSYRGGRIKEYIGLFSDPREFLRIGDYILVSLENPRRSDIFLPARAKLVEGFPEYRGKSFRELFEEGEVYCYHDQKFMKQ